MAAAAESQSPRLSVGATVQPSCAVSTNGNAASGDAPVRVTCSSGAQWTVTARSDAKPGPSPAPGSEGSLNRLEPGWVTITY